MIANPKPYPAYMASGVSWLGEVPAHWTSRPGFSQFAEKNIKNVGMVENQVLSLSYGRIVIKPPEKLHGLVPESFETYQIVNPGDIIIRSTDLQNDWTSLRVGIVRDRGIITSAYLCLRAKGELSSEYAFQLLHAFDLMKVFYGLGSGLRQNLSFDDFKRLPLFIPSAEEQTAIVRYLDYVDRHIRRYVRAKQKLINLLDEQKIAIIRNAVTRGRDLDVQRKSSNISWLDDIPVHWDVRKARSLFRMQGSGTTPNADRYYGGGVPWVMSGDLNDGQIVATKRDVTPNAVEEISTLRLYPQGSLVVAMYGATIGKTGILGFAACTNQACCVLADPTSDANVAFVQFAVQVARQHLLQLGYGGGQPNINAEIVKSLRLPCPPRAEQDEIVRFIDGQCKSLDAAVGQAKGEISLLHEYRSRLIADVVTGKLDVREAAANLPDEISQEETVLDDAAEWFEDDLEDSDSSVEVALEEVDV